MFFGRKKALIQALYDEVAAQEKLIEALRSKCDALKERNEILKNGPSYNWYQEEALRTAGTYQSKAHLINGVMGLNGEAGECIDMVKKHLFQKHELDAEHLAEELGDVAWYLAVTAHAIGFALDDVLAMNVEKLRKRYPDGFSADRSINRKE